MRLIALGQLTYAGAALAAGDAFEASDTDAFILINASRPLARQAPADERNTSDLHAKQPASASEAAAKTTKPSGRRTYRHTDMKAAIGE